MPGSKLTWAYRIGLALNLAGLLDGLEDDYLIRSKLVLLYENPLSKVTGLSLPTERGTNVKA